MVMEENGAYLAVGRHHYASQGYNAEQELGMMIPTDQGTLAALITRASSDEVAGFDSSAKRFILEKTVERGIIVQDFGFKVLYR
jgi:hypothetical protein